MFSRHTHSDGSANRFLQLRRLRPPAHLSGGGVFVRKSRDATAMRSVSSCRKSVRNLASSTRFIIGNFLETRDKNIVTARSLIGFFFFPTILPFCSMHSVSERAGAENQHSSGSFNSKPSEVSCTYASSKHKNCQLNLVHCHRIRSAISTLGDYNAA